MKREEKSVLAIACKFVACLVLLLLFAVAPATAQIQHKTHDDHRQQRKKFLKQASEAETEYKDTHLNINTYNFKIGESGRKRAKRDDRVRFQFNEAGEPVRRKGLFGRKKNKRGN